MSQATSIEWCDHSVNPIRAKHRPTNKLGHYCEKISSGCANCYASTLQSRFQMPTFGGVRKDGVPKDIEVYLSDAALESVLRRRKPTKFFWCDMTDMFGPWVPFEWIDKCFAVMALTPQHTHQVLTKRPERMAAYFDRLRTMTNGAAFCRIAEVIQSLPMEWRKQRNGMLRETANEWPIPGVWLGTSCENQQAADERIPHLLKCPAHVRFISAEPLLGPIDFSKIVNGAEQYQPLHGNRMNVFSDREPQHHPRIHWVIAGGESGKGARPCNVAWIRSIVEQCKVAGVACFAKQLGANFGWEQSPPPTITYPGGVKKPTPPPPGCNWETPGWHRLKLRDPKGGDMAEWPEDLRVREFPKAGVCA